MTPKQINTPSAPPPLPGLYSQAVRAGDLIYTSGFVGEKVDGSDMVEGSVADRARQIISNLQALLQSQGLELSDVVKATIFLSNLSRDMNAVNKVWTEMMPEPKPARSCIGVQELPAGGTDVEMEFVAYDGRR